jgi:predicted secreted hydrolase
MERSGRIVTSAALIVVVVAGSFAFADIVLIKALGLGVAIAVALDATVVRALLVPSTMRLLGKWNWWLPESIRRFISTRLHLPETATLALVLLTIAALLISACSPAGRVLGVDPPPTAPIPTRAPTPSPAADPQPVVLPRDEAPHNRLTEWWYYTGHLRAGDGRKFGFEFVIFRAERGTFPVSWASHLALTDESGGRFYYDQRSEIGPQVDLGADQGFDLAIRGSSDLGVPSGADPWRMAGVGGTDVLEAASPQMTLDLALDAVHDAPALHDGDGWIDFEQAGSSYYYSWTRMQATGTIAVGGDDALIPVEGEAWFDHQWGDFIAVGGGGWDWFAINLDDGTDLTMSLVRAADGSYPLIYGTLVNPDGSSEHLPREAFTITPLDTWTSDRTGATYPSGWQVSVPGEQLEMTLTPTVLDQELDTRPTTGVIYWEGSQHVEATRAGIPLSGEAYVELTGYAGMGDMTPPGP